MERQNVNVINTLMHVGAISLGIAVLQFLFYCAMDMLFFTQATFVQTLTNPISICFGMMFFIFNFLPACRKAGLFLKMHK